VLDKDVKEIGFEFTGRNSKHVFQNNQTLLSFFTKIKNRYVLKLLFIQILAPLSNNVPLIGNSIKLINFVLQILKLL
jgi:hypothetical protein